MHTFMGERHNKMKDGMIRVVAASAVLTVSAWDAGAGSAASTVGQGVVVGRQLAATYPVPLLQKSAGAVRVTGGVVVGQQLAATHPVILVRRGALIEGTVQLHADNIVLPAPGRTVPFGYTWNWGDRQTANAEISSSLPLGASDWSVPLNLSAPTQSGEYRILFGFDAGQNVQQVLSCTYSKGLSAVWDDGNDYVDMSDDVLALATATGFVTGWPYLNADTRTYAAHRVPCATVWVVVVR